jgi:tetratricopeptide (TPR) repeat protein
MAAINAVGYSAGLSSSYNPPLRNQVRAEILRKNPSSLAPLKSFFEQHRKRTDAEELSQYISFALSVNGPPDFRFATRDVDVPRDAFALRDFASLLARFYREAGIADLWTRSQSAIDPYIALYHEPVSNAVLQVNAYLRQPPTGIKGRRFQIFVELLAEPGQVQARSYGYDYTIVVTPSAEPRVFEIRHAYLEYLLDPLATQERDTLERKKPLLDYALQAAALDQSFREDFLLLTTESLVKVVEARLDRQPAGPRQALLQGFVLAPFFAEQLPIYEKQEVAMAYYYSDMVKAIDMRKEINRLGKVDFDGAPPAPVPVRTPAPPPPSPLPLTGAAKTLADADQVYADRGPDPANLEKAKSLYLEVLQQTADQPIHAAAYYGLAKVAALQNDPDAAERLFQKTLECDPAPQIKAWTLVFLGRLSLAQGDREQAARNFQEALKVDGASDAARQAASDGLQSSPKK